MNAYLCHQKLIACLNVYKIIEIALNYSATTPIEKSDQDTPFSCNFRQKTGQFLKRIKIFWCVPNILFDYKSS